MKKAKFYIGESPEFEGYYNPKEIWNGFYVPYFPQKSAEAIAKYFNENKKLGARFFWEGDCIMIRIDEPHNTEIATAELFKVEDYKKRIRLYDICTYNWCWILQID